MINSLQANLYANVVVASPVVGEAVGIIKIHTGTDGVVLAFLGEGNKDRSTDGRAGEEGVAVEENRLGNRQLGMVFGLAEFKTITSANHEDVAEAVFQTQGDNVIGVGVGGEGTGEGETVLSVIAGKAFSGEVILAEFGILTAEEQQVVRNTNGKQGGHLEFSRTHLEGLLMDLARDVAADGETVTGIVHRQTDVLQGDTDFEVLELTRHILHTGVNREARGFRVGDTLVDNLDADTTLDEVVERLRIMKADISQRGAEGTHTTFGLLRRGDRNLTETLAEEGEGDDTEVSLLAEVLSDGHGVDADAATGTDEVLGAVECQFRLAHGGQTGHIGKDGLEAADLCDSRTSHAAGTGPRINQQVGGSRLTRTVSVTCKRRTGDGR